MTLDEQTTSAEEQTRTVLSHVRGWYFRPDAPSRGPRRPLFHLADTFYFKPNADGTLRLYVVGSDNIAVLGAELILSWNSDVGAFYVVAYGRKMSFNVGGADISGYHMIYGAMYEAPPHDGPDEGGDGDPR